MKNKKIVIAVLTAAMCFSGFACVTANAAEFASTPEFISDEDPSNCKINYYSPATKSFTVDDGEGNKSTVEYDYQWEENGFKFGYCELTITGVDGALYRENGVALLGISQSSLSKIFDIKVDELNPTLPKGVEQSEGFFSFDNKVKFIGQNAFKDTNLKSIDMTGVVAIMDNAFANASYIEDITIPDTVKFLGKGVFSNSGIKNLTINATLNGIPDNLCSNATSLTTVTIPNYQYISEIGKNSFTNTSLIEPFFNSWTNSRVNTLNISDNAFNNCSKLSSITFPDNCFYVGRNAFQKCTSIKTVKAGKRLWGVDASAFADCTALTSIEFNDSLDSLGGAVFSNCTSLISVKGIPNSMHDWEENQETGTGTGFGNAMFSGCTSLKEFELPSSLTTVPKQAFQGCTSLVKVSGGSNFTNISESAFNGCTSLIEAYFPSVISIGNNAFNGCTKLNTTDFTNVTEVGDNSFNGCVGITEVPSQLISVGKNAYNGCTSIKKLESTTISKVDNNAFANCTGLTTVSLNADNYGPSCFSGCTNLKSAKIDFSKCPETATSMFEKCSSLENLEGTEGITIVSENTFASCTNLKSFNGENVRIIKNNAFKGCSSLETFGAKKNSEGYWELHDVGNSAFEGCTNMTDSLYLQSPTIGSNAFAKSGIIYVELQSTNNAAVIGSNAFNSCNNLETVFINCNPDIVKLDSAVFKDCTALKTVTFSGTKIPNETFSGCTSLSKFTVINFENITKLGGITVDSGAFLNTSALKDITTDNNEDLYFISVGANAFKDSGITKTYSNENTAFVGGYIYAGSGVEEAINLRQLTDNMFDGCKSLTKVSVANSVTAIPINTFNNCTSLSVFDNGKDGKGFEGILTINNSAFANTAFDKIELNDTQTIGSRAFYGSAVKELVVSGTINDNAFSSCINLTKVTIDSTKINNNAFYECDALSDVVWASTPTELSGNAFANCDVLVDFYIPGNPKLNNGFVSSNIPNLILYGDGEDNTVKEYADRNSITYMPYDEAAIKARKAEKSRLGDVDGNGLVTVLDAVKMQKFLLNKQHPSLVANNMDMNKDGKVNIYDIILLKRLLLSSDD